MKKKSTVSPEKQVEEFNNFMIQKGIYYKDENGQVTINEVSYQDVQRAIEEYKAIK